MTDPREPIGNAAAEFTALLGAVKNRAMQAWGDQPLRSDWSKQADDVATAAAAAAATALAGIATAAQTVGSVLDGWAQTHRHEAPDDAPADDAPAAVPTSVWSDEATPDHALSSDPAGDDASEATTNDEGVAWD